MSLISNCYFPNEGRKNITLDFLFSVWSALNSHWQCLYRTRTTLPPEEKRVQIFAHVKSSPSKESVNYNAVLVHSSWHHYFTISNSFYFFLIFFYKYKSAVNLTLSFQECNWNCQQTLSNWKSFELHIF